jgi:hypothetical protein
MYWRGAFPGYAIKTQPQLGADVDINREDVKQQLTDYSNALQRFPCLDGYGYNGSGSPGVRPFTDR